MDYKEATRLFLKNLQDLGKARRLQEIGKGMKGERSALFILSVAEEPCSPGDIGAQMEISSARVAALLNTLEKKELIKRTIDPEDRRKIIIQLTEKGETEANKYRNCSTFYVERMMEKLGEEDAQNLIRIVRKITEFVSETPMPDEKEESDVI